VQAAARVALLHPGREDVTGAGNIKMPDPKNPSRYRRPAAAPRHNAQRADIPENVTGIPDRSLHFRNT
jgi:hypothetical protein